ncbi:glutamate receptor-interacting protein 1-like isoform X2 [Tachypleus tridentatus]|uniref:glutamate receptor-interacting protein 1-like isoform X2 n=1 Tax=Tachypleus tridentatus TaxID=6853 RepID=UPI003FD5168F
MRIFKKLLASTEAEDGTNSQQQMASRNLTTELNKRLSVISESKRGTSKIELLKKEEATLGLIITGGIDKDSRPKISNIRPGSVAQRSDALTVGDYLISVNGIRTSNLRHDEIVNLLMSTVEKVTLEVEYEIPVSKEGSMCVRSKVIQVMLEKENGSFGFTLRGGACTDRLKSRPLTVTHVRPGGSTDREGTMKPGDRLIAVENINLGNASLQDTLKVLKQLEGRALFTVEYDISVIDAVCNASGPLLVEIDKTPGTQLGITLTKINRLESAIVIESIKQASVAERCGALHVGDHMLAIDGIRINQMTVSEASQILKMSLNEVIRLEVLPVSQMFGHRVLGTKVNKGFLPFSDVAQFSSTSSYNTLFSFGGQSSFSYRLPPFPIPQSSPHGRWDRNLDQRRFLAKSVPPCSLSASLPSSAPTWVPPTSRLSYVDVAAVTVHADHRGFGFALQVPTCKSKVLSSLPFISDLDPGGPAERTGVLHVGDKVLAVNNQSTQELTIEEVMQLLQRSHPRVTLSIEFDVMEAVVPSSGTFTVKLAKTGGGLGITITAPKNRQLGDPLIISDIKKGSVAHRTGTLQPGDKLLAIDSVRMDNCTIEDAAEILQSCDQIVKLRIRKDETFCEEPDASGCIVYTVELARHGGPLGITISGSEERFQPILISGLTDGGLAERTGAIHVGDHLIAINNQSLRGKPLSEAVFMLQNSGDIVTLKISRIPDENRDESSRSEKEEQTKARDVFFNKINKNLPSVDSAVESWNSSGLEVSLEETRVKECPGKIRCDGTGHGHDDSCKPEEWEDEDWELQTRSNHSCRSYGSSHSGGSDKEQIGWLEAQENPEVCRQTEVEKSIVGSDASYMISSHFCGTIQSSSEIFCQPRSQAVSLEQLTELVNQVGETEDELQRCSTLPHSTSRKIREQGQQSVEDSTMSLYSSFYQGSLAISVPLEIYKVTLFKDQVYEDFGFSISDGMYERGVYINRIRPGGPASISGILKPLDRILQVNNTKTQDFDCCLTVPLIAAVGDRIELLVCRPAYESRTSLVGRESTYHSWMDDDSREDCSSPQLPPEGAEVLTKTV